jgi:hypothetical protein
VFLRPNVPCPEESEEFSPGLNGAKLGNVWEVYWHEGRGSVPEGRSDRSLARSAWNSPTPKGPSRRARDDRAQT